MQRFLLALVVAVGVRGGAMAAAAADPCSPEAYAEACKAYPVKPGEHKKVDSQYTPGRKYDIYLPASYDPANEEGYPVLYTYNPGGGGMVAAFQKIADKFNLIVVGNISSRNNGNAEEREADNYALFGDIRARVRIDPTLQFAGGFSGGALESYGVSRSYCQQLSGVFAAGGWLYGEYQWNRDFWFPAGLLVARLTGREDKNTNAWVSSDLAHLKANKVEVRDISYGGGHAMPEDSVKEDAMKWLLEQARKRRDAKGLQKGKEFDAKCAALAAAGRDAQMFTLCAQAIATKPRQWEAFFAQRRLDVFLKNRARFDAACKPQLPSGYPKQALYYMTSLLDGAACAGDVESFRSLVHCLQGGARRPSSSMIWTMAVSQKEGIGDPKQALTLARALPPSACGPYELLAVAAAYAANGDARRTTEFCSKYRASGGNDPNFKAVSTACVKAVQELLEAHKKKP